MKIGPKEQHLRDLRAANAAAKTRPVIAVAKSTPARPAKPKETNRGNRKRK